METAPGALAIAEEMFARILELEDRGQLDIVEAEHMKGVLARHLPADRDAGLCTQCGVPWMCQPVRSVLHRLQR